MNYIELIRGFWRSHEEHSFSTTEIAVYFHLVEVCNICHWKNPFKRNNAKIGADLSISFNTLKNARNKLQQAGLISFKTTNGSPNVLYTLSKLDKVTNEVSAEVDNKVTNEVSAEVLPTKDKQNKTKQNIKKIDKKNLENVFEEFRKIYPGTKQGFKTEFENFCKKHQDYSEAVFLLKPALEKLISWRNSRRQAGQFVPEHTHLKTWLNQRRWESELENLEEGGKNESAFCGVQN